MGHSPNGPTVIWEDNQAAQIIATSDTESATKRSKHIDTRYHYTREKVLTGIVKICWCGTGTMVADMLTKSLDRTKLQTFWRAARGDVDASEEIARAERIKENNFSSI